MLPRHKNQLQTAVIFYPRPITILTIIDKSEKFRFQFDQPEFLPIIDPCCTPKHTPLVELSSGAKNGKRYFVEPRNLYRCSRHPDRSEPDSLYQQPPGYPVKNKRGRNTFQILRRHIEGHICSGSHLPCPNGRALLRATASRSNNRNINKWI